MIKLYLDTSVPSAYFDQAKPLRQLITQKWFENDSSLFELYVSVVAIEEIERLENIEKKDKIKKLIVDHNIKLLELSSRAVRLSEEYVKYGAIPESEPEDAQHIAIATVNNIESLASWNFKHIVTINSIRKVHETNKRNGYQVIEIGSLELYGGAKYGNL